MAMDNLKQWKDQWRHSCEQLAAIAREQRNELRREEPDWGLLQTLAAQWADNQNRAQEAETALRAQIGADSLAEWYEAEISPLIREADELVRECIASIEQQFVGAGTELRHTRDQLKLMRSYYQMDAIRPGSYFFDQKK